MHDCPPCQEFTPIFAELYNETNENGKVLEVIFFSGDKTQEKFDKYFGEQPWLAVPRGHDLVKGLAQKYNVRGVPQLIMLNAKTGDVVSNGNCVNQIKQTGPVALEEMLSKC